MPWRTILIAIAVLLGAVAAAFVLLPSIGQLITPGPVAQAHARIGNNCLACHVPFARSRQNEKCLNCHAPIAADIGRGSGFHGRAPEARGARCASCHSDHQGRDHALAAFDKNSFDHRLTDMALTGAHTRVACKACHLPARRYAAAPTACVACHRKDDAHKGAFGTRCEGCHEPSAWQKAHAFDHSVTGFNLVGKHTAVACEGCHAKGRFTGTPSACVACHRDDDIHGGSKGDRCENCHVASGWQFTDFNHNRDTRFALTGAHRQTSCTGCHGPGEKIKRPPTTCIGCHAKNDVHKGAFGRDCASCHSTATFKGAKFDHARTGFPLRQAHARLACKACHVKPAGTVRLPRDCGGCHRRDDPHRGALGADCKRCHDEGKWRPAKGFSHARTRFPLTGRHLAIACTACHGDRSYRAKGTSCAACHPDTRHEGRFGRSPDCAQCHNTSLWSRWTFDHARQAGFALDGKHARLSCYACHNRPAARARPGSTCNDCHRADDIHRGEFGANCAECHSTSSWKNASVASVSPARPGAAQAQGRLP